MIKVRCRTNLDGYSNAIWPTEMCCRPMVGDRVTSNNNQGSLYVVSIIHHQTIKGEFVGGLNGSSQHCFLEVELGRGC
jgi:hypothetical protein